MRWSVENGDRGGTYSECGRGCVYAVDLLRELPCIPVTEGGDEAL